MGIITGEEGIHASFSLLFFKILSQAQLLEFSIRGGVKKWHFWEIVFA